MKEKIRHKRRGRGLLAVTVICCALFIIIESQSSLTERFKRFCLERQEEDVFVMPSKTRWQIIKLWRESAGGASKLAVQLKSETAENTYRWLCLPNEKKRADFAEVTKVLHDFAASRGMTEVGGAYVELCFSDTALHACYDELSGWVWLPAKIGTYIEMYEKYQTFSWRAVMVQEGGEDFLRKRQLLQSENGELCETREMEYQIVTEE